VALSGTGDCYVVGTFGGSLPLPSAIFGTDTLQSAGFADGFIACYDSVGTMHWIRQISGDWYEQVVSVCLTLSGDVAVAGSFPQGTTSFGQHTVLTVHSTSGFVALYDDSGTNLWVRMMDGYSWCSAIACDLQGMCFVSGTFVDTCVFGQVSLVSTANRDMFVVAIDGNGTNLSAIQGGGADNQDCEGIAVASDGTLSVIGEFDGTTVTFGSVSAANMNPLGTSQDVCIARMHSFLSGMPILKSNNSISVYPCPFTDALTISFSGTGRREIVLYDPEGRAVARAESEDGLPVRIAGSFSPGMYLLVVYAEGIVEERIKVIAK